MPQQPQIQVELPENKDRRYVCGLQGKKTGKDRRPSHQSRYCEAPGGGENLQRLTAVAEGWLIKEFPLRPGKVKPVIPAQTEYGRHRSKSPDRRRSKEREEPSQDPNVDPWMLGEKQENQRRGLLKALNNARKELSGNGKVSDELKVYIKAIIEAVDASETKEEAKDFLEMLPDIERINHLKFLTSESHEGEILKQFEEGGLRVEDYL